MYALWYAGAAGLLLVEGIRRWWRVSATCWFCDKKVSIPLRMRKCWDCPHCDQYNGFTENTQNTKTSNGSVAGSTITIGQKPVECRKRRNSASPGRVGSMLSSLSLGQSDNASNSRSANGSILPPANSEGCKSMIGSFLSFSNHGDYKSTSILAPAKFKPPSPSSNTCWTQRSTCTSLLYNDPSVLWPNSRCTTPRKTINGLNGDVDDGVSVFSSVSQIRPAAQSQVREKACCAHSRVDRFWKVVMFLMLLCSFTTNAVVLYCLLIRDEKA